MGGGGNKQINKNKQTDKKRVNCLFVDWRLLCSVQTAAIQVLPLSTKDRHLQEQTLLLFQRKDAEADNRSDDFLVVAIHFCFPLFH